MSATSRWPDVSDETAAFFDRTIGSWRCDDCGTEFTVGSVYAYARVYGRGVECPVCPADGDDDIVRMGDHPESNGGDRR